MTGQSTGDLGQRDSCVRDTDGGHVTLHVRPKLWNVPTKSER